MEANSPNPEVEELLERNPELEVMLNNLEVLADSDLKEEDSKEVLSEIDFLKSLSLDELKDILKRNDPLDDHPAAKFLRLLASLDSLEAFSPERAKALIDSLGPISKDDVSKIKTQCKAIFNLSPSERATHLGAIKEVWAPYILSQDDVIYAYQKLHSPEWYLLLMDNRNGKYLERLGIVLANKYKRLYKGQHLLQKRGAIFKVIAACNMKYQINLTRDKYLAKAARMKWTRNLFARGFNIGYHYGGTTTWQQFMKDSPEVREIHAALSASFLDKRFEKLDQKYQEAGQAAKGHWEKGDPRPHHVMANDLIQKEGFSMLSYNTLKKKLLPIAAPFKKDYQGDRMKKAPG